MFRSTAIVACHGAAVLLLYALPPAITLPPVADPHQGFRSQLRRHVVKELAAGKLLVAARNLPDPNFARTVLLLTEFSEDGAMGLIVNRPSEATLGRLLPRLEGSRTTTIFFGGPVSAQGVIALLRSATERGDSRHVVGDVYLVNNREVLEKTISAGADSNRLRVYAGYAGWGARQLDGETERGSWHVVGGDGDVVFDPDPDTVWQRQMRRIESRSAHAGQPEPSHATAW